jgi:hypothetical protein
MSNAGLFLQFCEILMFCELFSDEKDYRIIAPMRA